VSEGKVQDLGHAVEGLPGLPCLKISHEMGTVSEEGVHVLVGLVEQPFPAELDGVRGQDPLRCRSWSLLPDLPS